MLGKYKLQLRWTAVAILLLVLSETITAQSFYSQSKNFNNGFHLFGAAGTSNFLNDRYAANVHDKVIKPQFGLSAGVALVSYPLVFKLGYFSSPFKVSENALKIGPDTKIRHRGAEFEVGCYLNPYLKYLQPFAAIGYQSSSMGIGLDQDDDQAGKKELSTVNTSGMTLNFGLLVRFSRNIALQGAYQRSLTVVNNVYAFQRLNITLFIQPIAR